MKLCKIKTLAIAGAVALGFAISGGPAWAQACQTDVVGTMDAQVPFAMDLCANVENTFTTSHDDADFGDIGVTGWLGQSGCLIMADDGDMDETNTACLGSYGAAPTIARIVAEDSAGVDVDGVPGQIEITGAFPDQEIRMWFQVDQTGNDVAPTGGGGGPSLYITQLTATTGAAGVNTQDGLWTIDATDAPEAPDLTAADLAAQNLAVDPAGNTYAGDTDAAGALTIQIGATIQTDGTFVYDPTGAGPVYDSDVYEGQFEVVLFW